VDGGERNAAEKGLKHFQNKVIRAIKAEINPDGSVAWCRERGLNLNARARVEHGILVAM